MKSPGTFPSLIGFLCGPFITAEAKPNLLFIVIDDLRDWGGLPGNAQVKTPNFDR